MLPSETLNKNYRISAFLVYLLSIVDIKNHFIASELILKLDMLGFELLTTALISSFTISWTHSITNILNLLFHFNAF